jgi:hypothetical protein
MSAKKSALIIANSEYEDPSLRKLVAPTQDAEALAAVLQDPAIGGFEVQTLLNAPSHQTSEAIDAFFYDRVRDHLLLLYFSGHGITDDDGLLYFAASNTQPQRLRSTAVAARWVNEIMIQCRSRRQVLLLDCCHSGAFARTKAIGAVRTGQQFEAHNQDEGRGRVVLTASDAIQYSFEGEAIEGKGVRSIFTHALVEGLSTGEADLDGDGEVSLDELYSYVHRVVKDQTPNQSPRRWDFDVEGGLLIAHSPRPVATPLPGDLRNAIESFVPEAREAAVRKLDMLLHGKHRGLQLSAHEALLLLKQDDSRRVSLAAEKSLEGSSVSIPESPEPAPPEPMEQPGIPAPPAPSIAPERPPAQPEFRERVQPSRGYRLITPPPSSLRAPQTPPSEGAREQTSPGVPAASGGAAPGPPAAALDSAAVEKVKQELAVYIGPMARILVSRAAKGAISLHELYEVVAAEIASPSDRQKFLASR